LKEEMESKRWLWKQHEETIDHLTSGCQILEKNKYFIRHDKVCAHFHYSICKSLGIAMTHKWYTHMPKPVYEEGDVLVLWNQAVHTDREVTANRPDIIIKNKKIENMHTESLDIEIQRMWNMKCTIIAVIIGATGIVMRSLKKNMEAIPGKHSIDSLQKTAILGTSHIIRKVLQCKT